MGKTNENLWLSELTAEKIIACPHIEVMNNPLLSTTTNVMVHCTLGFVIVLEEGKMKLVCPQCLFVATQPRVPPAREFGSHSD